MKVYLFLFSGERGYRKRDVLKGLNNFCFKMEKTNKTHKIDQKITKKIKIQKGERFYVKPVKTFVDKNERKLYDKHS